MTSPLLIDLSSWEGNHWVPPSVYSGLCPHPTQWEWGNVGVTYKLLWGLRFSHSSSFTGPGLSLSYLLYRMILPSSRLSYVRRDLEYDLRCLLSHGVMTQTLRLLKLKNTSPPGHGKKYLIPIPTTRVIQTHGIQVDQ